MGKGSSKILFHMCRRDGIFLRSHEVHVCQPKFEQSLSWVWKVVHCSSDISFCGVLTQKLAHGFKAFLELFTLKFSGTWEHDLNWIYFPNYVFSTSTQTSPEKLRLIWASHRTWWNWSSGRFTRNRAEMICRDVNRYNVIRRFECSFRSTQDLRDSSLQHNQCWDQSMYADLKKFKNWKFFFFGMMNIYHLWN